MALLPSWFCPSETSPITGNELLLRHTFFSVSKSCSVEFDKSQRTASHLQKLRCVMIWGERAILRTENERSSEFCSMLMIFCSSPVPSVTNRIWYTRACIASFSFTLAARLLDTLLGIREEPGYLLNKFFRHLALLNEAICSASETLVPQRETAQLRDD